jgi:serine/threonine protein kinase
VSSQTATSDSLINRTLGHYRITEKIGAGGMGEVYRAHDDHLDREVAIKVLPPGAFTDERARKRFRQEALALSKLNHPNIATIYDFDTQAGVDFLVMEYIPGTTLSEKLAARPLPEKEVIRLGIQLAEGLSAAHEHGVVHRDLKPGNLRLTPDGRLKILDFGLAKLRLPVTATAVTESLSETQGAVGTLPYMAPEQVLGEDIDARTDIHAAGSVLYEMATGQRPFAEVEPALLIGAIVRRTPQPPSALNPRVSPEMERILGKCLEKEPDNRYQSAKELDVDLRRLGVRPLSIAPASTKPRGTTWRRTKILAGMVVALLVLAGLTLIPDSNPRKWLERMLGHGVEPIQSLAVLPLSNLSGDPQQDYFADGMTEALITELSKIGSLKVISRTSVMQYKGVKKPIREIGRELGVVGVVEGSVLRSGDRVRITAQLIDAREDRHLWADAFDRDLRDVLALHSEVARAIADQVRVVVTPQEHARLASQRPVNPEAYQAYLKGGYYLEKRTADDIKKAIASFQHAIEIDPNYAMGYASLAEAYEYASGGNGVLTAEESFSKGEAAARRALELDDTLAVPHLLLAGIREQRDFDWAGAEKEYHLGHGARQCYGALLVRVWASGSLGTV